MNSEFLQLCGFDKKEAEAEQSRIERAFKIWKITPADVQRAEERIKRYFDMELTGMRKVRGIFLKEFIDMTLAKEEGKKVIYTSFPSIAQLTTAISIMSDKVYCAVPEPILMTVMGQYFNKLGPLLEEAEKTWLPPGQAHCPYLQARLTAILKGFLAKPDLLISVGIACDQAGKTDELVEFLEGIPVVHIDSCNDEVGATWPKPDPRRVHYLSQELIKTARVFQQVIGMKLTDDILNRGLQEWSRIKTGVDNLKALRGQGDPLPMSEKDWQNIFEMGSLCSARVIQEGEEALNILASELKDRIARGVGVLDKGAPRVQITFAHSSDPEVTEVLEKAGLATAGMSGTPKLRTGSQSAAYKTIWEQIAAKNMNVSMHACSNLIIDDLKKQCRDGKVDGMIIAALVKCRSQAIYPRKAKEIIEKELGIPVLAIEFDNLDSREYTAEYFKSRVDPFAEMLKNKKQ